MTHQDGVQIIGAMFIFAGYWLMAKTAKWSGIALVAGCIIWAYWAALVHPFAWPLFVMELILALFSLRTVIINWRV